MERLKSLIKEPDPNTKTDSIKSIAQLLYAYVKFRGYKAISMYTILLKYRYISLTLY